MMEATTMSTSPERTDNPEDLPAKLQQLAEQVREAYLACHAGHSVSLQAKQPIPIQTFWGPNFPLGK